MAVGAKRSFEPVWNPVKIRTGQEECSAFANAGGAGFQEPS